MKCITRVVVTAVTFALLFACATPNVGKDYSVDAQSDKGVAIGSITYAGGLSAYSVGYIKLPTGPKGRLEVGQGMVLIPYFPKGDFTELKLKGNLFAAELAAGDYEINNWMIGSGAAHVYSTAPFIIRFHVDAGRAVYLGNFHFKQTSSMGLTVTGAQVSFRDEFDRDLTVLRQKYPHLASVPVASAVEAGTVVENLGGRPYTTIHIPVLPVR